MNDPDDIRGWQRLSARTTTSGRLLAADVARLAQIGVQHVINLAPDEHEEALQDEARLLEQAGLRYTQIPVPFTAPEESLYQAFIAAYEDGEAPVHVHCIANYRVSAFLYRYHRDRVGMPEPEARALMEQQWSPESGDNPVMQTWARFIGLR